MARVMQKVIWSLNTGNYVNVCLWQRYITALGHLCETWVAVYLTLFRFSQNITSHVAGCIQIKILFTLSATWYVIYSTWLRKRFCPMNSALLETKRETKERRDAISLYHLQQQIYARSLSSICSHFPKHFFFSFSFLSFLFSLVACTRLDNPLCPLVGRSVVWSVTFYFFMTSLLLPKWFCDLK